MVVYCNELYCTTLQYIDIFSSFINWDQFTFRSCDALVFVLHLYLQKRVLVILFDWRKKKKYQRRARLIYLKTKESVKQKYLVFVIIIQPPPLPPTLLPMGVPFLNHYMSCLRDFYSGEIGCQ